MNVEAEALAAAALAEISNTVCGLGARIDQLEAARRDHLDPTAASWWPEGISRD